MVFQPNATLGTIRSKKEDNRESPVLCRDSQSMPRKRGKKKISTVLFKLLSRKLNSPSESVLLVGRFVPPTVSLCRIDYCARDAHTKANIKRYNNKYNSVLWDARKSVYITGVYLKVSGFCLSRSGSQRSE